MSQGVLCQKDEVDGSAVHRGGADAANGAAEPARSGTRRQSAPTTCGSYVSDTWRWNGTTWTHLSPATSPSARRGRSTCADLLGPVAELLARLAGGPERVRMRLERVMDHKMLWSDPLVRRCGPPIPPAGDHKIRTVHNTL